MSPLKLLHIISISGFGSVPKRMKPYCSVCLYTDIPNQYWLNVVSSPIRNIWFTRSKYHRVPLQDLFWVPCWVLFVWCFNEGTCDVFVFPWAESVLAQSSIRVARDAQLTRPFVCDARQICRFQAMQCQQVRPSLPLIKWARMFNYVTRLRLHTVLCILLYLKEVDFNKIS